MKPLNSRNTSKDLWKSLGISELRVMQLSKAMVDRLVDDVKLLGTVNLLDHIKWIREISANDEEYTACLVAHTIYLKQLEKDIKMREKKKRGIVIQKPCLN